MPTFRVIVPPTATAEPVGLDEVVAHVRADINAELLAAYLAAPASPPADTDLALWAELKLLHRKLRAARKKLEAYTQRYFAPQTLGITYTLNEGYLLPAGATALSVTGFFSTLDALAAYNAEEYRKGITVNREMSLFAAASQTFEVTAEVPADKEWADLAGEAILELVGEWYKNRETSSSDGIGELPVSWRVKLAEARVNVLGID